MKQLLLILILLLPTTLLAQRIRSTDVDNYIKQNEYQFIIDYQKLVKDTIYNDIYFKTLDFRKHFKKEYQQTTLAFNTIYENTGCEITINNEERYTDYNYSTAKNKERYDENNYFIYATVMHEISHYYFYQCILEMRKILDIEVNGYYYYNLMQYPNPELQYGAKFIEEGICEYLKCYWGLAPMPKEYKPTSKNEIIKQGEKYLILYSYSSLFVKDFMDCQIKQYGRPKNAIMILLHNRPPSYEEIQNPKKFYERLSIY